MDIQTPIICIKAAFNFLATGKSDYAKMMHERALERYDRWLGEFADNLSAELLAIKEPPSLYEKRFRSDIEITQVNWYGQHAIQPLIRKQAEGPYLEKFGPHATKTHFIHYAKHELPMEYLPLGQLDNYQKLQDVCAEYGLKCILSRVLPGLEIDDKKSYFGVQIEIDNKIWGDYATFHMVGQKIKNDHVAERREAIRDFLFPTY